MKNYVFLIGAQHQLFQVYEAIRKYSVDSSQVTVVIEDTGDQRVVKRAQDEEKFGEVIVFENWVFKDILLNPNKHLSYIKYCKSLRPISTDILFFASHYDSDNTLLFLSIVNPALFYLMDEGTASFTVSSMRAKKDNRGLLFLIKSLLYRHRIKLSKGLIYFTKYQFEIQKYDQVDFYLQEKFDNPLETLVDHEFIFLGSSIVEVGLLKEEDYLSFLAQIFLINCDKKVLYYPHRKESEEKLAKVKDIGFVIVKIDLPFEEEYQRMKRCPATIGSFFFTTVLDNISRTNKKNPELVIYHFNIELLSEDKEVYYKILAHLYTNKYLKILEVQKIEA
ncbi:hypothetical protein [Pedobacter frigoris]|uniref:Uncharacterized protein n=1 Tax=Pedobacter frigoris TaxID=2571272 RepID=A0A4U1CFE6_9SPHI|nr:hypothetical protein [Pedobacter frigoris]TKC05270.1 hypothetical protein FA047_16060 [Pedobacter frigoris]